MNQQQIAQILQAQRAYHASGATLPVQYRLDALKKLRSALQEQEAAIADALRTDLGKSATESYMCEIGMVRSEISHMLRHLRRYAREQTVPTPIVQFHARSYRKPTPYGVVLIMSPWNYPLLLTLGPLVDALAAGNTAVIKPSAYAPATANLLKSLLESIFPSKYVAVVLGGREENALLLDEKFDYIFFTGSKNVGQVVLEKAAVHLTPVTLELGGKSPCIVHKSADLKLAARRIVFGKFLNCGQTCVAPDYILCDPQVKDTLISHLKAEISRQYGENFRTNKNYGKIINHRHFLRLLRLIDREKLVWGGGSDEALLKIAPTLLDDIHWDDQVMGEEIFGPILPVLTYEDVDQAIDTINRRDTPLALYVFAKDKTVIRRFTTECAFGGGCVNDCIIHLATDQMSFGGMGESGMGAYHGKTGFDTFTHYKSIVDKKLWIDLPIRYQPYQKHTKNLIKKFLK
jgi:aldehyde dehydrogenase (NAD+)